MPLSSLMVEGSLRTAEKSGCESRVCTPEGFWGLFGKISERATAAEDREGQHQPCRWGRRCSRWLLVSLWHPNPPNTAAAQRVSPKQLPSATRSTRLSLHPFLPLWGVSARRKQTHTAIPSCSLSPHNHDALNPTPGDHSTGNPPKNPTLQARVECVKSLRRTRIWISTTDLYISTGLELKRTNRKDETPNLGSAASSDCSQAMRQQNPSPTDTNRNANTSHHIPIFQAPCIAISHQTNEIPLKVFSNQVAEKRISALFI